VWKRVILIRKNGKYSNLLLTELYFDPSNMYTLYYVHLFTNYAKNAERATACTVM
jgi:hypothetical protein